MTDSPPPLNVLILGGSSEASALVRSLAGDARFAPVISLAGRTAEPASSPAPSRIGGFGGPEGLARHLAEHEVGALVVALHPFAARMRANAVTAARRSRTPLLILDRPPWTPSLDDRWICVPDMAAAAKALGGSPRRVLLTVGRQELAPFLEGPPHAYWVRSIDPPAILPLGAELILARGPFSAAGEQGLMVKHGIEVLVTKNAGGTATVAKLTAARALGLPVIMVERPPFPDLAGLAAEVVSDVPAALAWLGHQTCSATDRGV